MLNVVPTAEIHNKGEHSVVQTNGLKSVPIRHSDHPAVCGLWEVNRKLGNGKFGEVFSGISLGDRSEVAIKFSLLSDSNSIALEAKFLKRLAGRDLAVTQLLFHNAREKPPFLVMPNYGPSLSLLRRNQLNQRLPLPEVMKLGKMMLDTIKQVHESGILHRDIKPSNFVLDQRNSSHDVCRLIDFGLAREWCSENGEAVPPRDFPGTCGTMDYSSPNVHSGEECGRRDDLWSLLYSLVTLTIGHLPWHRIKEEHWILRIKLAYDPSDLLVDFPRELLEYVEILKSLKREDEPPYQVLKELIASAANYPDMNISFPYRWPGSMVIPKEIANGHCQDVGNGYSMSTSHTEEDFLKFKPSQLFGGFSQERQGFIEKLKWNIKLINVSFLHFYK
jgi:tau tubulin kinase